MITALCMNPCIDRTVTLQKFNYGGMNRVIEVREDGAGKGVNVALAGRQAGFDMACIGILGQNRGESIPKRLEDAAVPCEFVPMSGAVRMNMKLFDTSTGQVTEINESGTPVSENELNQVVRLCIKWAKKSRAMILAGSLPPGCPAGFYGGLMEILHQEAPNCCLVVDAEGEKLAAVLDKGPFLVKPNRYELELLAGRSLTSMEDVIAEGKKILERGATNVVVSLGSEGALALSHKGSWYIPAIPCQVASTVGAGDAMLTAVTSALCEGLTLPEALCRGVALATACVASPGTGFIRMQLYEEFLMKANSSLSTVL